MADTKDEKSLPERIKEKVKETLPGKSAPSAPADPYAIFEEGFLAAVRKLRPADEIVKFTSTAS